MLRLASVILAILLGGCGFELRTGSQYLPQVHALYLQTENPYSELTKEVEQTFKIAQVTLLTTPQKAPYVLNLIHDEAVLQTSGYGMSNQVSVNTVTYRLTYQLLGAHGKELIPKRVITVLRTFTINTNQALNGDIIPASLVEDMRHDAIHQLLMQMAHATKG